MKYELYLYVDGSSYKAETGKDDVTEDNMRNLKRVIKGSQKTDSKVNRLNTISIEIVSESYREHLQTDVADIVECRDEYKRLHTAIATLLPKQQDLIRKVYFEGISQREIARSEGVTEGTIRYRLKQIHDALKKILK